MNVSRSSYYEWVSSSECDRVQQDKELIEMIKPIFKEGRHTYGARRIKMILARENVIVSRRRIVRLMQEANLICKTKRKFKATTDSNHNKPIAPNLLDRKFNVDRANHYWVGNIT